LIIPRAPATLLASRTERAAPVELHRDPSAVEPPYRTHHARVEHDRPRRVATRFSIAQLFDTTVAKIKSWNRLNGNVIATGARLKIVR
jgi:hypothetical protein